jgi:hypothetical protein
MPDVEDLESLLGFDFVELGDPGPNKERFLSLGPTGDCCGVAKRSVLDPGK